MKLALASVPSPVGTILLAATQKGVCSLDFADCRTRMQALLTTRFGDVELVPDAAASPYASRVRAYLAGELDALADVSVDTAGTPFQRSVWSALRAIPVGSTQTYGDIARAVARPSAVRAVGAANGRNPVALIVPCHRVIGADGTLTGYAGGISRKHWLLQHERALS